MLKKSFLLILVAIIILSSKPFAFELNTDNLNNNNNLFNRFIINKESYNSEVTQIEFVVLMGRLLSLTDDVIVVFELLITFVVYFAILRSDFLNDSGV